MDYSVIYNTSSTDAWSQVFHICLEHCDSFRIFYPDGEYDEENPLLAGKDQFEKLPNNKILPWDGMKDSILIEGKLTEAAKHCSLHLRNQLTRKCGLTNCSRRA